MDSGTSPMQTEKLLRFLQSTQLISPSKAEEIAPYFTWMEIPKNGFLLEEGKISDAYLFLENGAMRAFAHDTHHNEVTTNFFTAGQAVFEVSSFFNRVRSKENIQAITDCNGWYLTYAELNKLFHAMPEFREFGRSMLVKGYAGLKNRMLSMITETAEERYAGLLQAKPEIFRHAQLKHIASYLGITDTSLSRIRKELSQK